MAGNGKGRPFLWNGRSGKKSTRRSQHFRDDGELVHAYLHGSPSESAYAAKELIEKHMGMVVRIANSYYREGGAPLKDLIQSAWLGFFRGLPRFDRTRALLTSYAPYWILAEIMDLVVAESFAHSGVRIRHENIRRITHIRRAQAKLSCLGKNIYDPREILDCIFAEAGNGKEKKSAPVKRLKQVEDCLALMRGAVRLDRNISCDGEGGRFIDFLPDAERVSSEELIVIKDGVSELRKHLGVLNPRHLAVIERRFGLNGFEPHSLEEIAVAFGVTREAIRQTEARAFRRIRRSIDREALALSADQPPDEEEER